jgi:hypothetical protein
MNIDVSHWARIARTSATSSSRFPQAGREENDSSLGDWRPGATLLKKGPRKRLDGFTRAQKERLLQLRAMLVATMTAVAADTRADTSDSSVFATHNGDAGSDACDRDFALRLLSLERNALIEIALVTLEKRRRANEFSPMPSTA